MSTGGRQNLVFPVTLDTSQLSRAGQQIRTQLLAGMGGLGRQMGSELFKMSELERQAFLTGQSQLFKGQTRVPTGRRRETIFGRRTEIEVEPQDIRIERENILREGIVERKRLENSAIDTIKNRQEKFQRRMRQRSQAEAQQERDENFFARQRLQAQQELTNSTRGFVKSSQRSFQRRMRRQQQADRMQERDENFFARQLRQEESARLNMTERQRFQSRMMMGGAGVLTAATMPISGFTPLTVGFASMSGVGFGVAAGIAVLGRAAFDGTRALNRFQDSLIEVAEASNAVSDSYREQQMRLKGFQTAQGFVAAEFQRDRMEMFGNSLDNNIQSLTELNAAWGQFRNDLTLTGLVLTDTASRLSGGAEGLVGRAVGMATSGLPGPLRGLIGGYAGSLVGRGRARFAGMGPAIEEAIENLQGGRFQAAYLGPQDMFRRIQRAAVSRGDRTEEQIKWQIKQLEELKKISDSVSGAPSAFEAGKDIADFLLGIAGIPRLRDIFGP